MAGKKSKQKRKSSNGRSMSASKSASKKMPNAKLPNFKDPLSKGNLIRTITDVTCVARKDVLSVLDTLSQVIEKHIKSGGPGTFVMPGLYKIKVVKKPARAARKGVNPFTGEEIMIKARPASKAVKIKPLKKLKEMVTA